MDADAGGTLRISVSFPLGSYCGADNGAAEDLPAPSRLHEAFVAAAGGGSWAVPDGPVLVICDRHRAALEWLEREQPIGVVVPKTLLTRSPLRRYRWRASLVKPNETDFEPRAALDGPVDYVWPSAPREVVAALEEIAAEVTHVGRADSVAIVRVQVDSGEPPRQMLRRAQRRGPGRVMRVASRGRTQCLLDAHREASRGGEHRRGDYGNQAGDVLVTGANETATELCRFAPAKPELAWPYDEVWALPIEGDRGMARAVVAPRSSVATAVGVHRAIVAAIASDVPPFITGRDGERPLRGAGHLAIQPLLDERSGRPAVLLGIPAGVPEADRELLRGVLSRGLRTGQAGRRGERRHWFTLGKPQARPPVPFWDGDTAIMRTAVPLALETTGGPRGGGWTLEDAVVCSIGYAMRGVLEDAGVAWGTGWSFRAELVERLRGDFKVGVVARRVQGDASRFVHRVRDGELVVAAHAAVALGLLAPQAGGFLAIGRSRHLGGGLLVPLGSGR
ncbi:type I-G CRISPR-associated protein Csb2 [Conexibacter arvalis]|nr:type I-U CRISPR-associated protein Csb2 [Conexibacter arvalis]